MSPRMGEVRVTARLTNAGDEALVRRGCYRLTGSGDARRTHSSTPEQCVRSCLSISPCCLVLAFVVSERPSTPMDGRRLWASRKRSSSSCKAETRSRKPWRWATRYSSGRPCSRSSTCSWIARAGVSFPIRATPTSRSRRSSSRLRRRVRNRARILRAQRRPARGPPASERGRELRGVQTVVGHPRCEQIESRQRTGASERRRGREPIRLERVEKRQTGGATLAERGQRGGAVVLEIAPLHRPARRDRSA